MGKVFDVLSRGFLKVIYSRSQKSDYWALLFISLSSAKCVIFVIDHTTKLEIAKIFSYSRQMNEALLATFLMWIDVNDDVIMRVVYRLHPFVLWAQKANQQTNSWFHYARSLLDKKLEKVF